MGNFLYHGKDRKQCYYEPNCVVCVVKSVFQILRITSSYYRTVLSRKERFLKYFLSLLILYCLVMSFLWLLNSTVPLPLRLLLTFLFWLFAYIGILGLTSICQEEFRRRYGD
ncbi:MAG: hypothetical protein DRN81_05255 [Thermoproteota archaeon]|nr:MAG: hypothetical protein DRN81_05255 [Candidatus Korarchaeota archaeon]